MTSCRISLKLRSVVTHSAAACTTLGSSVTESESTFSTMAVMSVRWCEVRVKSPSTY